MFFGLLIMRPKVVAPKAESKIKNKQKPKNKNEAKVFEAETNFEFSFLFLLETFSRICISNISKRRRAVKQYGKNTADWW